MRANLQVLLRAIVSCDYDMCTHCVHHQTVMFRLAASKLVQHRCDLQVNFSHEPQCRWPLTPCPTSCVSDSPRRFRRTLSGVADTPSPPPPPLVASVGVCGWRCPHYCLPLVYWGRGRRGGGRVAAVGWSTGRRPAIPTRQPGKGSAGDLARTSGRLAGDGLEGGAQGPAGGKRWDGEGDDAAAPTQPWQPRPSCGLQRHPTCYRLRPPARFHWEAAGTRRRGHPARCTKSTRRQDTGRLAGTPDTKTYVKKSLPPPGRPPTRRSVRSGRRWTLPAA